jgi:metal-responsive CopG/Arc/MetJ family transcriptional regulator
MEYKGFHYQVLNRHVAPYRFMSKNQVTISLDPRFLEWLDQGIASFKFANRSHGIEYCINKTMLSENKEENKD